MMQKIIDKIVAEIEQLKLTKENIIIALDGRCAAGKTTVAEMLKKSIDCNLFRMDDYFLRPEQRTEERLQTPGGNVDRERFLDEVLFPLYKGENVEYSPFDCTAQMLKNKVIVQHKPINIVEGSYSCHPDLFEYYDLHIFVDVSPEIQLERIVLRNGEQMLCKFKNIWIPLEEKYFDYYDIRNRCELVFDN